MQSNSFAFTTFPFHSQKKAVLVFLNLFKGFDLVFEQNWFETCWSGLSFVWSSLFFDLVYSYSHGKCGLAYTTVWKESTKISLVE